jgi:hypothetical protein
MGVGSEGVAEFLGAAPVIDDDTRLASFTDAEGAGAHCQVGAQRLLCARMLDWLDDTLGTLGSASRGQR